MPILYGFPDPTPELMKALEQGKVILGGCVVEPRAPKKGCPTCRERQQDQTFQS